MTVLLIIQITLDRDYFGFAYYCCPSDFERYMDLRQNVWFVFFTSIKAV